MVTLSAMLVWALISRGIAVRNEDEARQLNYDANIHLAQAAFAAGNLKNGHAALDEPVPSPDAPEQKDRRDFEWYYLWVLNHPARATLADHSDDIKSVAFSPDSQMLATAGKDHRVILWNVQTHQKIATLNGHTDALQSVTFSPDNKMIATGSVDRTVKLWDVQTRQERATLAGHIHAVWSVVFAPNGKMLASGSGDQTVKLWNVETRQEITTLGQGSGAAWSVAFSKNGRLLATGHENGAARILGCSNPETTRDADGSHRRCAIRSVYTG
jgi:WD40 repeat protein